MTSHRETKRVIAVEIWVVVSPCLLLGELVEDSQYSRMRPLPRIRHGETREL